MTEVTEESVVECAVCSTDIAPEETHTTDSNEVLCGDCVQSCNRCGDIGSEHDEWRVVDGDIWCEDCTDRCASWCESCEEYSTDGSNYISDRDVYWCHTCSDSCYYCEDCSEYFYEGYCESCQDSSNVIHDYNYRPDPIFHTTGTNERLFFGIEIEVEAGRNLQEASEYANRLEGMDLAYLKSDGSLNCGFEIVTHPMTHDFYKNEVPELFDTLNSLRVSYGVKSWGTTTCGVHVHISRSGFNGGAHMHRFLNLVYSNQEYFETIAGRSSDRWAKFDDVNQTEWEYDDYGNRVRIKTTRSFARKLDQDRGSDRYSAVNTNNSATLELRIFKGSTQPHVIKSYIDLAHASVEYTRSMSVSEVKNGALTIEPFIQYIFDNAKLYPELVDRTSRLFVNFVRSNGQEVSA